MRADTKLSIAVLVWAIIGAFVIPDLSWLESVVPLALGLTFGAFVFSEMKAVRLLAYLPGTFLMACLIKTVYEIVGWVL